MVAVTIMTDGDTFAGQKDASEKKVGIKAISVWASVHGLGALLRSGDAHDSKTKNLQ